MLAHHLTGIDLLARVDEELAAVLEFVDGIGVGGARLQGYHGAIGAAHDVALIGLVLLIAMGHDGLTLAGGEHIGTQSDDAARGDVEGNVRPQAPCP